MIRRPAAITVIGFGLIALGSLRLVLQFWNGHSTIALTGELGLAALIRCIAILLGVMILRGRNWARWGLGAWLGYHVLLSAFHSQFEFVMHALLSCVALYLLFRHASSSFFITKKRGWMTEP